MTTSAEMVNYRIVIVHGHGLVLALSTADGYRLPRVEISKSERPAKQLREKILATWAANVLILDVFAAKVEPSGFVFAELLAPGASSDLKNVALDDVPDSEWTEEERTKTVALLFGEVSSPFSRVGWLDEAMPWLESVTHQKLLSKYSMDQYNAGGRFSLIRFSLEGGSSVWFKATGEPNTHEFPVTCLLSQICGDYLPEVIASKPEWNAWLMTGKTTDSSTVVDSPYDLVRFLESAVDSLAALQIRTMGQRQALFEAGAFDQRADILRERSEALFTYLEEAMSFQTSTKAPRISKGRFLELRGILDRVCDCMDGLNIPESIVHGDLNLGNILRGPTHCQFIDWCEAFVGNPLITLQHLLLFNASEDRQLKARTDRTLKTRYATAMVGVCDPENLEVGFACMPFLAALSTLYGRGEWFTSPMRDDPRRQAYARTLARHMDRAATDPDLLNALST